MGSVSLSFLFSAHRPATSLVAALARLAYSRRSARLSRHLLLLPKGSLSSLFARSACLCRRRALETQIQGRDGFPAHSPKFSPLFFLYCRRIYSVPLA